MVGANADTGQCEEETGVGHEESWDHPDPTGGEDADRDSVACNQDACDCEEEPEQNADAGDGGGEVGLVGVCLYGAMLEDADLVVFGEIVRPRRLPQAMKVTVTICQATRLSACGRVRVTKRLPCLRD